MGQWINWLLSSVFHQICKSLISTYLRIIFCSMCLVLYWFQHLSQGAIWGIPNVILDGASRWSSIHWQATSMFLTFRAIMLSSWSTRLLWRWEKWFLQYVFALFGWFVMKCCVAHNAIRDFPPFDHKTRVVEVNKFWRKNFVYYQQECSIDYSTYSPEESLERLILKWQQTLIGIS